MKDAPKGLRLHIAVLGRCNVGKSSLLNALCGQDVAIVSATPGTTADPVEKTLEMAPLGPVVFLDTAGTDDTGELGGLRAGRSLAAMTRACGLAFIEFMACPGGCVCGGGQPIMPNLLEYAERKATSLFAGLRKRLANVSTNA